MGTVHHLDVGQGSPELAGAVDAFIADMPNRNTARSYGIARRALVAELDGSTPVAVLDEEEAVEAIGAWFARRWGVAGNATVNARLDALRSAALWWRSQDLIYGDPVRRVRCRPRIPDRTRALGKAEVEALLTRPHLSLRERTLWQMLSETAARVEEILGIGRGRAGSPQPAGEGAPQEWRSRHHRLARRHRPTVAAPVGGPPGRACVPHRPSRPRVVANR